MKNNTASKMFRLASVVLGLALGHCGAPETSDSESDTDAIDQDISSIASVNPSRAEFSAESAYACAAPLVTFEGVSAYSNGNDSGSGHSCNGQGQYGLRYQCVELVMRYFKIKYNVIWSGNAKYLLDRAPRASVDVYSNGDSAHPPRPGDMVVWPNGQYGHVALITAVHHSSIDIIEQNVANSNGKATLPYDGSRIGPRWNGWVPTGWAHAKANHH